MRSKIDNNIGYRPTWAEVDMSALEFNFRQVKKTVGDDIKIMTVVKCDAYGHGLLPVARKLADLGADYLGVAGIDEAVILRENKIRLPILILGNILERYAGLVIQYNLTQTLSDHRLALRLNQKAKSVNKTARVHIKVDTGMGRLGVLYKEAGRLIKEISLLSHLRVEGLSTHFPCADCDEEFTNYQISLFNRLVDDLRRSGIQIPLLHTANSVGIINYPSSHFNLVRPGLMLYGIYPKEGLQVRLRPVLSLKTRIICLKNMPSGWGISYGRSYIIKRKTRVAVLPIGYGDGYPRILSNRASVLINGRRFRVSGAVCMDQIMVDIGNTQINVGDEVVLIGRQKGSRISVEELAYLSKTIPYEIICGIGSRVPRIYLG